MIDAGLVLSRLLHHAATTTLFGASLFPLLLGVAIPAIVSFLGTMPPAVDQ
jgi:hypothetical protein